MARDYRNILAFQKADDLAMKIYEATGNWPTEEKYGLTSQIRRAAVSAATNIVEGASRETLSEFTHFLNIARGSLRETGYLLHLSHRLGYLDQKSFQALHDMQDEASRVLWGLMQSVADDKAQSTNRRR